VVALVSGGKDSCMAMLECVRMGHRIVALANLLPSRAAPDELDSYMFQTVGHTVVHSYAQCMGLPLFRHFIGGQALNQDLQYVETQEDEVESLYALLSQVKKRLPSVQAVASGAILSDYQRLRVEHVCDRLGLVSLAYLWQRDQKELLREMAHIPIEAVLVKVAAMGLDPHKHLGRSITSLEPLLLRLSDDFGCHPCGEGGEYETLTLDCPLFHQRIVLDETEVVIHSDDHFAQVGYLRISKHHLEPKASFSAQSNEHQWPVYESWKETNEGNQVIASSIQKETIVDPPKTTEIELSQDSHGHFFACSSVAVPESADEASEQLNCILFTIKRRLEEASLAMEDVCFVYLYLSDMDLFGRCNGVYRRYFSANPPSRLCVQVPLENNTQVLVECFGQRRHPDRKRRKVLHVQSISHWAPACIGPYSQATALNGLVHLAGQIGLDPSTMKLVGCDPKMSPEDRIREQTMMCLKNIDQVLKAMKSSRAHVIVGTCFLLDMEHHSTVFNLWCEWLAKQSKDKTNSTSADENEDDEIIFEANTPQREEPLVRFIQVQALPRGADVEFQVIASDAPTTICPLPSEIEGLWSPKGLCFAQAHISSDATGEEVIGTMRKAVQAANSQLWTQCLFFRLFLPTNHPGGLCLQQLREATHPACLSVVPCISVMGGSALLECSTLPAGELD